MPINHQSRMFFHSSEHRILRLLDNGKQSFEDLLKNTWGIYPEKLLIILKKLENNGQIKRANDKWELSRALRSQAPSITIKEKNLYQSSECFEEVNKRMDDFKKQMPEPHPHNFDWRFSNQGLQSIVEHLLKYHDNNDKICIISAPSLFVYLNYMNFFEEVVLIERSQQMINQIREIFPGHWGIKQHDLQYPLSSSMFSQEEYFSCIVADPPWYQDYYELFLSRAKDIVKPGGLIHLALFPPFSKKSALRERTGIFSFAQNNGIDLVELKAGLLRYETPPFELKALENTEFQVKDEKWRRGDFATFYVSNKTGQDIIIQVEDEDWEEFPCGKASIHLRHKIKLLGFKKPQIKNVVEGKYYPSVSRKYYLREKIDLWTSGNQAYEVEGSHVIGIMLHGILKNQTQNEIFIEIMGKFDIDLERIKKVCFESYNMLVEIVKTEKGRND